MEKKHYAVRGMNGNTKSLCGRSSGFWVNVEELTTHQNLTANPSEVTCSFCQKILPRRLEHERKGRFKKDDAMPLNKGAKPGSKGFGENIATEIKAGKPAKQAEAIAYSVAKDASFSERLDAALESFKHDASARVTRSAHSLNARTGTA